MSSKKRIIAEHHKANAENIIAAAFTICIYILPSKYGTKAYAMSYQSITSDCMGSFRTQN